MRKVEKQMVQAVRDAQQGRATRKVHRFGNTVVELGDLGQWRVTLFGNLIATGGNKSMDLTLAGWNTATTRSRLNALVREFAPGNGFGTHRGTPLFGTREIGAHERIRVEFLK